ncbi:fumarylacetoacetate hydrolase family protein [Novosphingobium sp. BL-52-GroH]|uniref:fumarylacetoacetate hydrolase family protein n=1 Tax=Novosphingobium sp. BL-52-GroH TaxID=3349877 RepID=UPI00384B2C8D
MKLCRVFAEGAPFWGIARDSGQVDLIDGPLEAWAPDLVASRFTRSPPLTGQSVPLDGAGLLAPIDRVNKVVIAGANYRKHVAEFGLDADTPPVAFLKPYDALTGPHDAIRYPPVTAQLDYEVELVAVVGRLLAEAPTPGEAILGYTIGNDVSARDLQKGTPGIGMDFLGGKGLDATTPVGPWIVTRDEFGDASPDLRMTLSVNGEGRQDGRSCEMTFDVPRLLAFVNTRTTMRPGDILFTGTPTGVGQASGRFLQDGDRIEASIEGIGTQRNIVRKFTGESPHG